MQYFVEILEEMDVDEGKGITTKTLKVMQSTQRNDMVDSQTLLASTIITPTQRKRIHVHKHDENLPCQIM